MTSLFYTSSNSSSSSYCYY